MRSRPVLPSSAHGDRFRRDAAQSRLTDGPETGPAGAGKREGPGIPAARSRHPGGLSGPGSERTHWVHWVGGILSASLGLRDGRNLSYRLPLKKGPADGAEPYAPASLA